MTPDHFTEQNVKILFEDLDSLDEGFITNYSLLKRFKRELNHIEIEEISAMMDECTEFGINAESEINFE